MHLKGRFEHALRELKASAINSSTLMCVTRAASTGAHKRCLAFSDPEHCISQLPLGEVHHIFRALVLDQPASAFFLKPITSSAPGLGDYTRIIKKPMDLEAIGVHVSTYQTFLAFARDVRLVFNNARIRRKL